MKIDFGKRADTNKPGFQPAKPGKPSDSSFIRTRCESGPPKVGINGVSQNNDQE